jgi:hypothetical protein
MKAKPVITALLLVFVVASVGYAVYGELTRSETPPVAAAPAPSSTPEAAVAESAVPPASSPVVQAYYFHSTQRCVTCRSIESNTEAALKASFADKLASGALAWSAVNIDLPENAHFVQEFQLSMSSVVLAEVQDGAVTRWENLAAVWENAHEPEKLQAYVQEETTRFLEGDPTP